MTKLQESQLGGVSRANESRTQGRRKLAKMAYVELGQDNGGILLNVSEGGLAIQSALTLICQDLPKIRFQLPQYRGWITASGKVAWMSQSKTEAGIQFTNVPEAALTEIRRWVSREGEPEEDERPRVLASVGPDKPIGRDMTGDYRGPQGHEIVEVPAGEISGHEFRFTDYSMFASDPRVENLWMEAKPRRSWGGIALLAIFLAASFFVLGATMGQGHLEEWMNRGLAYVGREKQPSQNTAQAATEQAPVSAPSTPGAVTPEVRPNGYQAGVSTTGVGTTQGAAKPTEGTQDARRSSTPTTEASAEGKSPAENEDAEAEKDSAEGDSEDTDARVEPAVKPAVKQPAPKTSPTKPNPPKRVAERYASGGIENGAELRAEKPDTSHRSILVSAPAPGGPPLVVGFPDEAVSASTLVAISARRSIRIPPRGAGAYSRSERVTIGNLVSHSDPFYPVEARNKRIEGIVELRATIGRAGGIINVTPIRGPDVLSTAGINAVREWRYEPTFVDGDPVEIQADIMLVFRLP